MIVFGSFALLRPAWLIVMPVLALLLLATRRRDDLGDWPRAVDAPLLAAMLRRQGGAGAPRRDAPVYLSLALIALALSGPAAKSAGSENFRNLDATLIVIDVSQGARLQQATAAAQLVLARGGARQIGLVLYAGDVYLASPMTEDAATLQALLFAVDDRTVPDGGTRADRALAFARRLLREANIVAGDVALISDGEGVDAKTMAEASSLSAEGRALHTLLVAPRSGAAAERAAQMTALAAAGGGVAGDAARAEAVAERIAGRRIERVGQGALRTLEWRDYGRILLLLAAAPLLLCCRERTT
jgi:Ca-activated chloride channel family protein